MLLLRECSCQKKLLSIIVNKPVLGLEVLRKVALVAKAASMVLMNSLSSRASPLVGLMTLRSPDSWKLSRRTLYTTYTYISSFHSFSEAEREKKKKKKKKKIVHNMLCV